MGTKALPLLSIAVCIITVVRCHGTSKETIDCSKPVHIDSWHIHVFYDELNERVRLISGIKFHLRAARLF